MSGLLEADIDLGLESGAAAFDPLSLLFSANAPSPIHHRNRLTLYHQRVFTATDIKRLALALALALAQSSRPFHMSLTSRLFTDSCPLSRSRASVHPTAIRFFHPSLTPSLPLSLFLSFAGSPSRLPTRRFARSSLLQTPGPTCLAHLPLAASFSPLSRHPRSRGCTPGRHPAFDLFLCCS